MSLSNTMEVITKGSVDFSQATNRSTPPLATHSRASTSHSVRTDSQLSLECLPPEIPYYSSNGLSSQSPPSNTTITDSTSPSHPRAHCFSWSAGDSEREEKTSSQALYDRIQQLSDRLHTELGPHHDTTCELANPASVTLSIENEGFKGDTSPTAGWSADMREELSSRNSTLVGEELLISSNEDLSIEDTHLSREREDSGSESHDTAASACMVHPEISSGRRSLSVGEIEEALGHNREQFDSYGGNRQRQERVGNKMSVENMDPKLYKALEKMRKLDEKLANISKKEREVKRQRRLLEQQLGVASDTQSEGQSSTALVTIDDCEGDSHPTSPVFVTHLDDNSSTAGDRPAPGSKVGSVRRNSQKEEGGVSKEESKRKESRKSEQQENQHGTNFIKRNIELASEAGAAVSMTDDEKKRLEELLCDSSELEDPYSGPAVVGAIEGGGFSYSEEDLDKMRNIDSHLQLMLPPSDWESICSATSLSTTPSHLPQENPSQITITSSSHDDNLSLEATDSSTTVEEARHIVPGEEVLHHFQISREESKRLKDIEERLMAIKEENERIEAALVPIPVTDLQTLLDQCTRELQCSSVYGSHSGRTSYSGMNKISKDEETDFVVDDVV